LAQKDDAPVPVKSHRPRVEPLSQARYRVQFTASQQLKDKLDQAQELLSHVVPPGDLPGLLERALELLIAQALQRRYAVGVGTRRRADSKLGTLRRVVRQSPPRSRHIPAQVRRRVFERDGGRCTYWDGQGRRCNERCYLQFEHRIPFALGGEFSVDNLTLRCAAHNAQAAVQRFGRHRMVRRFDAR
jgi:5-methylcytosine-specific restriction endonuclease McrA